MVYKETKVKISDNSGARVVRCFQLAGCSRKKSSKPGSIIVGSVTKYKFNRKVVKKQLCQVLLLTSKKNLRRSSGGFIKFDITQGILISKDNSKPLGTRVFGPAACEVKKVGNLKLISIVRSVI